MVEAATREELDGDDAPSPRAADPRDAREKRGKPGKPAKSAGAVVRPWVRAIHRDIGYVAVGLTVVYAVSGLAVNHLTDWKDGDASFVSYSLERQVGALPAPTGDDAADDRAVAAAVLQRLGIREAPRETYRVGDGLLDLTFDKRTLHVETKTGRVVDEGQRARFFLRAANWLHLNRGKKAWTYAADAYAAALLFLAFSGLFMIPGRKGLFGRGAVLVGLGVAMPVAYVVLSGGP